MAHDIVLGDFGRDATLRYLQLFSDYERTIIQSRIGDKPFFDEYRQVTYTVVGCLGRIKEPFIKAQLSRQGFLDSRILVGSQLGVQQHSISRPILEEMIRQVVVAYCQGARAIRIIIPCNTLAPIARCLGKWFSKRRLLRHRPPFSGAPNLVRYAAEALATTTVSVPYMPGVVANQLANTGHRVFRFMGTDAAHKAYTKEAAREHPQLRFIPWLPDDFDHFEAVLTSYLAGVTVNMPHANEPLLVGCTDLVIPHCYNSIELFARAMATDSYEHGS